MNSTPTDVLAADCNGVELMTTQRQSFAVAEEPGVQAVVARMEADGMVTDGELEEEFQRLCGGEERHSTLEVCDQLEKAVKEVLVLVMAEVAKHMRTSNPHREAIEEVGRAAVDSAIVLVRKDALDRQQRELAELRAMKKRFEEQELELQRLKGCVELAPGQTEFGTTAAPDWLQRICERDGIDLASAEAQFVTAWRPEETGRFLDAFKLKYPANYWSDSELCALLRTKLVGKARHQYEALPLAEREGGFSVLVKAMLRETRTEAMSDKIVALGEVKRLKKLDRQSIAEFCVDLERLTCRAYPELNERALAIERAHLLYQQIAHWPDSYHLLEALEEEDDPYSRLKETAKRIERRNLTLANSAAISNAGSDHRRTPKVGVRDSPKRDSASGTQLSRKSEAGLGNANARDCTKSERADSTQHRTSLSARLAEPACRAIEIGSPGVEMVKPGVVCPSEREFDVSDTMHCLHVEFRCQGQRMPALPGVPSMNLPECNVGSSVVAGDLIPTLPQPAYDHRVENVLEAARVIAIWQGCGSLAEKIRWILDPQQKRITPKSVGLAYAFFRARCMHVAIMASTVPKDGILRHARLTGWQCDTVHILELGWRLSSQSVWNEAVQKSIGFEHRKVLMVVPHNMRSLKRINGFKDTKVFYYREFKEIHLRRTELFDNNIGHVLFVAPTVEPRPGTWLPLVYAAHMWLACGVRLYLLSGPRTHDDNSWFRAAEQLRSHIHGLLEGHQELIPQVIDKLPIANGAVDSCSPCFAVAILEDAIALVPERQSIMASTVPKDGILRHARLTGWQCDTVHILELGWRLSSQSVWNEAVQKSIGFEHRKVLMVVPHNMRSLKRINGFKDTKVFYYREFKEIHLRRTELFDNNIGHVLFVAPTVEPRPGTWLPLVYAAHMWLACGVRLYLLSGPRTHDDNSWFRAAEQLRSHIHGLLEGHQELIPQVIDKLPIANGAVDSCSPCFAVAILEDANALVPERQCRLFYEYCGRQLSRWLSLETIPSSPVPKSNRQTYPHAKEGGVAKRQERRKQQRKRRSELKAIEKGLRRSSF
ncbi:unnamed protein product [Heligmosomoides polygyrus]|uniref:CCHC-type domain-containing protein n=1 Tax=Heligmosomoides polygyrus TaxID=6339 RepID=A0A183GC10_HELPZ|nr:unnamed protein product [Heligmosomoides polygyrus]